MSTSSHLWKRTRLDFGLFESRQVVKGTVWYLVRLRAVCDLGQHYSRHATLEEAKRVRDAVLTARPKDATVEHARRQRERERMIKRRRLAYAFERGVAA